MLETPVLLLIFNRPEVTLRVFEAIRNMKPTQLFIAADGPRKDRPDDAENCRLARQIIELIDWNCEVKTLLREENLGCKYAVSQAIDWFFENVEQGIILEDDTLPNQSFFLYCENLLNKYKSNTQIMHISGSRLIADKTEPETYYFSKYPHVWGWATWKRAWKFYDVELQKFPVSKSILTKNKVYNSKKEEKVWTDFFRAMQARKVDTWDTQWNLAIWLENGLCITPPVNLVTNIGWGIVDATHTHEEDSHLSIPALSLDIHTLIHPDSVQINKKKDVFLFEDIIYQWRIRHSLKKYIHDNMYYLFPESIKVFYRKLKNYFSFFK